MMIFIGDPVHLPALAGVAYVAAVAIGFRRLRKAFASVTGVDVDNLLGSHRPLKFAQPSRPGRCPKQGYAGKITDKCPIHQICFFETVRACRRPHLTTTSRLKFAQSFAVIGKLKKNSQGAGEVGESLHVFYVKEHE